MSEHHPKPPTTQRLQGREERGHVSLTEKNPKVPLTSAAK